MNKANIFYYDIGDYLSREEKLKIVKDFGSISKIDWQKLNPNEEGDWISQRNDSFSSFINLTPEKKFDLKTSTFYVLNAIGIATNRDIWVFNYSKKELKKNIKKTLEFYNQERTSYSQRIKTEKDITIDNFINKDTQKISWTVNLKNDLEKNLEHQLKIKKIETVVYRPFCKQFLYYDKSLIERPGIIKQIFPNINIKNLVICLCGIGVTKEFSTLISNELVDLEFIGKSQCFPLYYYEKQEKHKKDMFDTGEDEFEYVRKDGVSDYILGLAHKAYGKNVTKEDIFYYVYGFLHSPEYREKFSSDLKKMLPRLPLVEDVRDFWAFSKAGRSLAELHINYESVASYEGVKVTGAEKGNFKVDKMRYPKKDQKDTINYNSNITITNIPLEAYQYVVNGKSAIDWIMERYQVTTHKESGIKNDPNDWAEEVGNPRYILDLLLSIINVSMQTIKIVESLPKLEFE